MDRLAAGVLAGGEAAGAGGVKRIAGVRGRDGGTSFPGGESGGTHPTPSKCQRRLGQVVVPCEWPGIYREHAGLWAEFESKAMAGSSRGAHPKTAERIGNLTDARPGRASLDFEFPSIFFLLHWVPNLHYEHAV